MSEELTKEQLEAKVFELEQKVRILTKDLIHDSLTGLKTRKYFIEETGKYFEAITDQRIKKRKKWFDFKNLSFIFFDLDHFKTINDTYGHAAGDGVLKAVAGTIMKKIRKGDIAARWGGEEIVVALLGVGAKEAEKKAEDIRKAIERMSFNNLPDIQVTTSAGVSSVEEGVSFDETISRADKAAYQAKETGRNKVVSWTG